jgi:O-antigen ligase
LIAGWCAATLLVVPIAKELYARGLHLNSPIPLSGKQRIVLWGYTAEQVGKRPLLGIGIASTKKLDERNVAAEKPAGYPYPRKTGPHAHNIYLQTWYELGATGAVLLLVFGLSMIAAITTLPERFRPYAAAAFASAATMGAFTWSMWQAWFMGLFALTLMVILLGAEFARRHSLDVKL